MLQDIRDNSQGVVAKVIIGLIIAVFALFGMGSIIGGFITSPSVAEINGEEISEAQLQSSTQSLLNSIGGGIDSLDQDLLEQIALNQIIEEVIMRQSAENAFMRVSSDRIDRSIIESEQFQINGVFDSELAVRTMASQGFSVPLYRDTLRQRMLLAQVANAYSSSNFITAAELQRLAELSAQTRDFRYLSITLGIRTLGTAISDEEILAYYNDNQGEFREDDSVSVRYVLLDKDAISEEIAVDEADLRAQYEEERGAFEGSSEKRASHIMFEVGADLSEQQALELAAEALQRLADGEEFAALAVELSTDVVSAEEGGDIGYTDGSAFPEQIEAALVSLELGEISDPVVTDFGVHLVKLTEDAENVFQSYEEVAERIEREFKSAQVELLYAERLEDLSNLAFETGDLLTIAEDLNLEILQSEAFSRAGGSGIFANRQVISAAYLDDVLLEGNNSDVVELNTGQAVVLRVQEFIEASVLPLEEVEPEIAVLLRTDMEREAVRSLGEQILAAIDTGEGVDQLLVDSELEWISETEVSRSSIVANRELLSLVFAMPKPQGTPEYANLTLDNGTFLVIELTQVNPGSVTALAETERNSITDSMLVDLGNSDFTAFLANLRENADIQARATAEGF